MGTHLPRLGSAHFTLENRPRQNSYLGHMEPRRFPKKHTRPCGSFAAKRNRRVREGILNRRHCGHLAGECATLCNQTRLLGGAIVLDVTMPEKCR
jgi:hypothetical protein